MAAHVQDRLSPRGKFAMKNAGEISQLLDIVGQWVDYKFQIGLFRLS